MSWIKNLATSGLREMLKAFESELNGMRADLEELAQNRKNTWAERFAVMTAYDWLNKYLVEFKMIYLSEEMDKYPELRENLERLITKMDEMNVWMTDTFMDLMNAQPELVP